jgi:hypothetical protein
VELSSIREAIAGGADAILIDTCQSEEPRHRPAGYELQRDTALAALVGCLEDACQAARVR